MNFEQYLIKEGVTKSKNVLEYIGETNLQYIWDNCDSLNEGVLDKLKSVVTKFGNHGKALFEFFKQLKAKKDDPKVKELYYAVAFGAGTLIQNIQKVLADPKFKVALAVLSLSPTIKQFLETISDSGLSFDAVEQLGDNLIDDLAPDVPLPGMQSKTRDTINDIAGLV
jgi:hypothetical protein